MSRRGGLPGSRAAGLGSPAPGGCTAGGLRRSGPGSASSRSPDRKASAAIWWLRYCRCGIRACRACRPCTSLHPEALQPHHIVSSVHAATSLPDRESSGRLRKRASPRRPCVQRSVHRDGRQAWYAPAEYQEAARAFYLREPLLFFCILELIELHAFEPL